MAALELYLTRMRDTRGLEHIRATRAAREYVRGVTEDAMVDAIRNLKDAELLRAVIEIGVSTRLQRAVTSRYDTLVGPQE